MPRILIVEDNRRIADVIARFLVKKGFEADLAPEAQAGFRSFAGSEYDLLLVNRELPGISGDSLCRKIRESQKGANIPIILMSGSIKAASELDGVRRELKLSVILPKPFTSDILSAALSLALPPGSAAPAAVEPPPPPTPPAKDPLQLKGELSRTPFEKVLLYVMKKKGTGVLAVSPASGERRFFFIGGALAGVEQAAGDGDFGAYLARKKLIDPAELAEYRNHRKRDGGDPRDLFVKMGCLTPQQFGEESQGFLHERLVDCFAFRSGTVMFAWAPSFLQTLDAAAVFMPALFLRAFKMPQFNNRIQSFLEEKARIFPDKAGEFYEYQNHLAAEAGDADLFDRIDGSKTCADLVTSTDADDAAVILFTLDYLGALSYSDRPERAGLPAPFPVRERTARPAITEQETFEDLGGELSALADEVGGIAAAPQAPAAAAEPSPLEQDLKQKWEAIKDKNYYEMFGMTQQTFSFDTLKKVYFEYTRTYGPDKFFGSSSEIMSLAEELLSKISNAFETLSNVVSKENYDEKISAEEKVPTGADDKQFYEQVQFQSGQVFVDQGQYSSAEKAFTNCVNLDPNKPDYLAYLALAVYHNPVNKGNPAAVKRAKDLVNKSLQLGKLSIAYALKGIIYMDEGGINFAEAEFNKALRLNPKNKTALKMLEQIRQKRDEEKKGIFQRIFR